MKIEPGDLVTYIDGHGNIGLRSDRIGLVKKVDTSMNGYHFAVIQWFAHYGYNRPWDQREGSYNLDILRVVQKAQ